MAMMQGEYENRPYRESVLDHALSNEGGFVFHSYGPARDGGE
jgi:hypothetical protein